MNIGLVSLLIFSSYMENGCIEFMYDGRFGLKYIIIVSELYI